MLFTQILLSKVNNAIKDNQLIFKTQVISTRFFTSLLYFFRYVFLIFLSFYNIFFTDYICADRASVRFVHYMSHWSLIMKYIDHNIIHWPHIIIFFNHLNQLVYIHKAIGVIHLYYSGLQNRRPPRNLAINFFKKNAHQDIFNA